MTPTSTAPPEPDPRYDWLAGLPLRPGPPDLRMGIRNSAPGDWLRTDTFTSDELDYRAELLDRHEGLVLLEPGWEHAVVELTSTIESELGHPVEGNGHTGLHAVARSLPEDVLLMADTGDGWRLRGGALVFPNQWTLADKLGGTLTEIHAPVEGYAELLDERVTTFFDRLGPGRIVSRRNWFFHDDPELFQPVTRVPRPLATADEAGRLWVRSEWQTLRRLPETDVIVFTVKTQIAPIAQLGARPAVAEAMIAFLEAATDRSLDNKDALGRRDAIVAHLRRGEAATPPV